MTAAVAALAIVAAGCGSTRTDHPPPGNTGATRGDAQRPFSRRPSVGVACPKANSIACDRVGVAVWLRRAAARVTVTVNGEHLRLRPPRTRAGWWEGYLQPAGLIDGALRVTPDRGRFYWQGSHARSVNVAATITQRSGTIDRATTTVPLRAGWG
jgi:hypothetical protein